MLAVVVVAPAAARPVGHNGQIAFSRVDPLTDTSSLYTINPDGTHEHQLLAAFGGVGHWSPDGSQIVSPVTESGPGLVVTDADTGDSDQFPGTDEHVDAYCYLPSTDGQRVACEAYGKTDADQALNGIYTVRASDGADLRRLTSAAEGSDQPGDYSPNSKRLVYSHFASFAICCGDEWLAQSGMYVLNANGTGARKIAPCCGSLGSWSPRGNEIVFSRHVPLDAHSSIWIVHADGSGLHEVDVQVPEGAYPCGAPVSDPNSNPDDDPVAGGCFDPQWSPDGRKIVFVRGDSALGRNLYTVNPDGTGLTQVTHGDADQSNETPDWGVHPLAQ
jgi:TolB protein